MVRAWEISDKFQLEATPVYRVDASHGALFEELAQTVSHEWPHRMMERE